MRTGAALLRRARSRRGSARARLPDALRRRQPGRAGPARRSRATGSGRTSPGCRCSARRRLRAGRARPRERRRARRSPSLHAGWRGLLAGIVEAGVAALGGGVAAAIGPAIGPCCYEVGDEVAEPYRERFGAGVVARPEPRPVAAPPSGAARGRRRRRRAHRPLHRVQPRALLLPPARHGTPRACREWSPMSPDEIRDALRADPRRGRRPRDRRRGDEVRLLEDMAVLAEAGVEVVGENRAQDLEAKHARLRRRLPLAFHRPPAEPEGEGREQDLRARATRSTPSPPRAGSRSPRSSRSTSPARRRSRASRPRRSGPSSSSPGHARAHDDAAPADDPEASRPYFRRLRELAAAHGLRRALDGHDPGLQGRRRGGSDARPRRAAVL